MNGKRWLRNRIPFLLVNVLGMAALACFLLVSGNSRDTACLVMTVWILVLCAGLTCSFLTRKRYFDRLMRMAEELDERYLIPEVMEEPFLAEDLAYYRILRMAERSMLENVGDVKRERAEYREYIEQWIHEIKTPITGIRLLCDNNRSDLTRGIMAEVEKIERYTEQSLYYARSENTQKDFAVREISLLDVMHGALADNKYLLMQEKVRLELPEKSACVYSDEKWLRFILDQLIVNAVKYARKAPEEGLQGSQEDPQQGPMRTESVIRFLTEDMGEYVTLSIQDNGMGIDAADLPRVFEKGFTGQNGRKVQHSTGLGLYLCKKLCDKLGIRIEIESGTAGDKMENGGIQQTGTIQQIGTTVKMTFYLNHLIHEVQEK